MSEDNVLLLLRKYQVSEYHGTNESFLFPLHTGPNKVTQKDKQLYFGCN